MAYLLWCWLPSFGLITIACSATLRWLLSSWSSIRSQHLGSSNHLSPLWSGGCGCHLPSGYFAALLSHHVESGSAQRPCWESGKLPLYVTIFGIEVVPFDRLGLSTKSFEGKPLRNHANKPGNSPLFVKIRATRPYSSTDLVPRPVFATWIALAIRHQQPRSTKSRH